MNNYEPAIEERKILDFWQKEKIYKFKSGKKKIYSIDTPPPTVSGDMHAGHAFSYSQQDFIARFRRMRDGTVFYPFGTDDNGLPTERLVERLNNIKSKEVSRTDFIDLCLRTLKEVRPEFVQSWKNLGISCDYELFYSTIDENSRKISQKSFIDLFKKDRIYRKEFPTIWCPECQTAIAQAELEDKETQGNFITVKFSVNGKELLVATTRPELLGACVAIFVNPKDKRYNSLKGNSSRLGQVKAKVPIFGFEVPIIADSSASMDKGTGAMMVCSYGDKYDVDSIARHKLKPRIILDKNGIILSGKYQGLKVKEARKNIIEDLEKAGFIKGRKTITHTVNVHDKCGTEIEFIPTEQWFVKILDKKKELISQGRKIKWHPEHMRKRYENWISGLQWDWVVSRDRYFGVPIPVWHCKKCKEVVLAKESELPVDPISIEKKCSKCGSETEPEKKVLDTWATSSLSPQIISSLVGNKIKIPFSLRPQAHDIIRTWAFYTVVRSLFQEKKLPWDNVMISGFVTLGGEKLSKSKGIVIDPKEIMKRYSADALRYMASSAGLGQDFEYQEKDLVSGQKLVKKLLNASNFVFMNMKGYKPRKPKKLEKNDIEFLGKLNLIIQNSTEAFKKYEYNKAKIEIEKFFWSDFCDTYLELVKDSVYNGTKQQKESTFYTLYISLLTILKLISPITPFITEHIYQEHFRKNEKEKSIHVSEWPKKSTEKYTGDWEIIKTDLSKVNKVKSESKLPLNVILKDTLIPAGTILSGGIIFPNNGNLYLPDITKTEIKLPYVVPYDVTLSGSIIFPQKDFKVLDKYQERFLATSGATKIKPDTEIKKKDLFIAGTGHNI